MEPTQAVTVVKPGLYGTRVCVAGDKIDLPESRVAALVKRGAVATGDVTPKAAKPQPAPQQPDGGAEPPAAPAADEPADPTFEELGLAGKVADLLHAGGIRTLGDIEACEDLTALDGIGAATAATITAAVEAYRKG